MKGSAAPLIALFLSLLLYFANLSAMPYLSHVYNLLRSAIYPLFELKGSMAETTRRMLDTYAILKDVSQENQRLRKELEEYRLYRTQLLTCERNLRSLSESVDLPFQSGSYPLVYAGIIAYDPSGRDAFVLVNRGQDRGLSEGMLVFLGENLVGIVERVYGSSSRIRTVFSDEFTLSAGARDRAYIYRGGFPTGSLLHVRAEDEIKVGDLVYVRVPGKSFPQLHIGTVQQVSSEEKGFFKKVEVKPSVDIRKASFLLVIKERL